MCEIAFFPEIRYKFLRATGKEQYADAIKAGEAERLAPFHNLLIDLVKIYMVVGGMPEVVSTYLADGNVLGVRAAQEAIVRDYERDFAKHAPIAVVPKIQEIFRIIPKELARENKKFLFSMLRAGARASEYESALLWLEDAGIGTRVNRVETVKLPLTAYYEKDSFKLFLVDVGLLGALAGLDPKIILDGDELFVEFKGAMAEQLVFQELVANGWKPWYYRKDKPTREVDFLLESGSQIVPIEVKSGEKTYAKSFGEFIREHEIETAFKISQAEYRARKNGAVKYWPMYLVEGLRGAIG